MGKSFVVAFSQAQADRIKKHAAESRRSASSVVREAIDQYFAPKLIYTGERFDVSKDPINMAEIADATIDTRKTGL